MSFSHSQSKHPRVALYCRVSTSQQTTENQTHELSRVAEVRGWSVVETFCDDGISGAKGRNDRPALDRMLKKSIQRKFDLIAVWSVDRLGRSLHHLVETVNELHSVGIDLYIHQQAIDTSTPAGKLAFSVFGALAEYERELIRERVRTGLDRARRNGTRLGRPSNLTDETRIAICEWRKQSHSIQTIARQFKVGTGTIYKVLSAQTQVSQLSR